MQTEDQNEVGLGLRLGDDHFGARVSHKLMQYLLLGGCWNKHAETIILHGSVTSSHSYIVPPHTVTVLMDLSVLGGLGTRLT